MNLRSTNPFFGEARAQCVDELLGSAIVVGVALKRVFGAMEQRIYTQSLPILGREQVDSNLVCGGYELMDLIDKEGRAGVPNTVE